MGAIYFSINTKLAGIIAEELSIKHFVETGTYTGDTCDSVKDLFQTIDSIELSDELYDNVSKRFERISHIQCHLGDSAKLVAEITKKYSREPILYWLDAHWCAGSNTAGEESQCPLIEEIKAIGSINHNSVIWIDDARYFMAPPPAPLEVKGWPTFQEVLDVLSASHTGSHEIIIADDTILLIPRIAAESVRDYLHHYGADLLMITHKGKWFSEAVAARDALDAALKDARSKLISQRIKNIWQNITK